MKLRIVATGKAAHAGNHHADGANAIWALCRFVLRLDLPAELSSISGGEARNTVPDHAELWLEVAPELEARVRELAATSDVAGTRLAVTAS